MGIKFELLGTRIEFDDMAVNYNKWRQYYEKLGIECANQYMSEYYEKYHGIEEFSEKGLSDGCKIINDAISKTVQNLINSKIYDIDENSFVKKYGEDCYSSWQEAFDKINEKYMEIILNAEELDDYRHERKQNRGRLVGGGFGLEGAAKGMLTAGAVNLATGAVHGAVNIIGKGISSAIDSSKKSKLFAIKETKDELWSGIYSSVFDMHLFLCVELKIPFLGDDKADSLYNNLSKMSGDDVKRNIIQIITLDPYILDVYKFCIKTYGDKDNEVQKIARFFGFDMESYKVQLMEDEYLKSELVDENSTLIIKNRMIADMNKYGLKAFYLLDQINKKLVDFDIKARTVGGDLYESREDACLANKEFLRVYDLLGTGYHESREKAELALQNLRQADFESSIGEKYIKMVEDILEGFDRADKTYNGVYFESEEEMAIAKIEDIELQKIMKSTSNIQERLDAIKQAGFKSKMKEKYINQLEATRTETEQKIEDYKLEYDIDDDESGVGTVIVQIVIVIIMAIFLFPRWGWIGKGITLLTAMGVIYNLYGYIMVKIKQRSLKK